MAGVLIRQHIEEWIAANPENAEIKIKKIIESEKQVMMTIGEENHSFLLNYPNKYPDSKEALTLYTEDDNLQEWFMKIFDYSQKKRPVGDLLAYAAKAFISLQGGEEEEANSEEDVEEGEAEEPEEEEEDYFFSSGSSTTTTSSSSSSSAKKKYAVVLNPADFFTGDGSKQATDRLIKDLQNIMNSDCRAFGYEAKPISDNLYDWDVKLFDFEGELRADLNNYKRTSGADYVTLNMKFPKDYPFAPPFIRVVRPRFAFHTGHVTIGGSICMELLTRAGWSPGNDIESIIVQIRSEMMGGGARLDLGNTSDYSESEARAAFERVARQHGWE